MANPQNHYVTGTYTEHYAGHNFTPNSEAHKLWLKGDYVALKKHLKAVHQAAVDRGEIREVTHESV